MIVVSPLNKDVSRGTTKRIKRIARNIVESSPLGTIFQANGLSLKVQSVIGELDMPYFYESYNSRSYCSKGTTVVEYGMKRLELDGVVKRVSSRTWERIS